MNKFKKILSFNMIKNTIKPFQKCEIFESEKDKLLCCGNKDLCPLILPKRNKCDNEPCCSVGNGAAVWCEILEFPMEKTKNT